ncbi:MAG: MFS transporter [Victivallaceae bacterium]|nr:MFS transporter [Victivallaceae bacterium]
MNIARWQNSTRKLIDFFGLKRSIVGLLGMVILVGLGEKMAERFLPLYLLALGGMPFLPGLLNALDNLLSALYSLPGAWLTDRFGGKRSLLIFNLIAMLGFLIVVLVPNWIAVFIGSFFFLSWTAISLPATMELVAVSLPKNKRIMGVSMHSLIRRFPMALGPVLGGLMIDRFGVEQGVRIAFGCALALAVVAAILQQWLIAEVPRKETVSRHPLAMAAAMMRLMSRNLRNLLIADILVRFCEQIPYAYLAIWAMQTAVGAKVSGFDFGILTTIEMTVAVLVYLPVAWLADRSGKKPFVATTFIFFTLFPLLLYFSRNFWWLTAAFAVRGLKEFGEPTRKALIMDLAPEDSKAAMFGTYYLLRDVVVTFGAGLGAWLWTISPAANFLTAAAFGVIGTIWFVVKGRNCN